MELRKNFLEKKRSIETIEEYQSPKKEKKADMNFTPINSKTGNSAFMKRIQTTGKKGQKSAAMQEVSFSGLRTKDVQSLIRR